MPTETVTIVRMAVVDAANGGDIYDDIQADDLPTLPWGTPAAQVVTAEMTVVFEVTDGRTVKIGKFQDIQAEWAVKFFYEEVMP